jgi:hypothetical protein
MPKVVVYQGGVRVIGQDRDMKEAFFVVDRPVYGATLGALMDALFEESIHVYGEVVKFIAENKAEDYSMAEDYWFASSYLPHVLRDIELDDTMEDTGSGSHIVDPLSIVTQVAMTNSFAISNAFALMRMGSKSFQETESGYYTMPDFLPHFQNIKTVEDVRKAVKFDGDYFDLLRSTWEEKGQLAEYRRSDRQQRTYHEITRKARLRRRAAQNKPRKWFAWS